MTTPLLSIIIATYNAEKNLELTLNSLRNQVYTDFEVLLIDGGSSDQTLTIANQFRDIIRYLVSESDTGIYDAWNKGLKKATGEWISFIGAGDIYLPDALQNYVNYIDTINSEIDFISSRVNVNSPDGKILFVIGRPWQWPEFLNTMMTAHVGALHSKNYFDRHGYFNSAYKIAGDYELLMRAGDSLRAGFLSTTTANMLYGGVSQSFLVHKEDMHLKINTGKVSISTARVAYYKNFIKTLIRKIFHSLNIYRSVKI